MLLVVGEVQTAFPLNRVKRSKKDTMSWQFRKKTNDWSNI